MLKKNYFAAKAILMRSFLCGICILFGGMLYAQTVQGIVLDSVTQQPIASANVYFSNTAMGTTTNAGGSFLLNMLPPGKYDLIVSFVGYELYHVPVPPEQRITNLRILLKPRVAELKEVVLRQSEKFGWEKWGSLFMEHVVGTSLFAEETELLNNDALRFYFDKTTNKVTATANKRLLIRNKALGYDIKFDLGQFAFDTLTKDFAYEGFPFFEEMKTGRESVRKRWEKNRETAYHGSLMHFYRCLYDGRLAGSGFEVRRWGFLTMEEKKRVKKLYTEYLDFKKSSQNAIGPNPYNYIDNTDSIGYFRKVMDNAGDSPMLLDTLLKADSLVYRRGNASVGFRFPGSLQVLFRHRDFPVEYGRSYPDMINRIKPALVKPSPVTTNIYMKGTTPITVYINGAYLDGESLYTDGYWAWAEKLSGIVPYDYFPKANNNQEVVK